MRTTAFERSPAGRETPPSFEAQLLEPLKQAAVEQQRFWPLCSSRYLDPVTVRAAPRNVSFAT